MNVWRKATRAGVYLLAATLLMVCVVWIINRPLFDEQLDPQLETLLAPYPMPPADQNAYIALTGIRAAAGRDIVDVGQQLTERYRHNRQRLGRDEFTEADYEEIQGTPSASPWADQYENCNHRYEPSCFGLMLEQVRSAPLAASGLQEQLARYREITAMPSYRETQLVSIASPLPPFVDLMELARLTVSDAYVHGGDAAFVAALHNDLSYWRRMLAQSRSIIGRMVAHAGARFDLQAINWALRSGRLDVKQRAAISPLLTPLDEQELTILPSLTTEASILHNLTDDLRLAPETAYFEGPAFLLRNFMQRNATANLGFAIMLKPMLEADSLDGPAFAAQYRDTGFYRPYEPPATPATLYNIGGKLALDGVTANLADYQARLHDLNAMLAATRLHSMLASLSPDSPQRAQAIAQSINPWTAQPFALSEGKIVFECTEKDVRCEVTVGAPADLSSPLEMEADSGQ